MLPQTPQRLSRILRHPIWPASGCLLALVALAVLVNMAGVTLLGGVTQWTQWLHDHRLHFFLWRLCVYALTVWGWLWMRRRIRKTEGTSGAEVRLIRVEAAAIATVVLVEAVGLRQQS